MDGNRKLKKIVAVLRKYFASRRGAVHYSSPFLVLISCILSQRTREEKTEEASARLFSVAKTPEELSKLSVREIEKLIKPANFYKQKARRIKLISKLLVKKYGGRVPEAKEELLSLPGVGFKTSAVVLSYGYGIPVIAVDTHVERISKRLGLVDEGDDRETVRKKLEALFPERQRFFVNLGFVNFGRSVCTPLFPRCELCELKDICKFYRTNFMRYSRQKKLVDQKKLSRTSAVVCGLGGLGSFVALELASLGLGRLVLIDNDRVSITDLNRQVLYRERDVGRKKAEAAARILKALNSSVKIEAVNKKVESVRIEKNAFVFSCTDNWDSRFFLDNAVHESGGVLIHGAAEKFRGMVYIHVPGKNPCLKDIFLIRKSVAQSEVVSPTCAVTASLMVSEFLKFLHGKRSADSLICIDLEKNVLEEMKLEENKGDRGGHA